MPQELFSGAHFLVLLGVKRRFFYVYFSRIDFLGIIFFSPRPL